MYPQRPESGSLKAPPGAFSKFLFLSTVQFSDWLSQGQYTPMMKNYNWSSELPIHPYPTPPLLINFICHQVKITDAYIYFKATIAQHNLYRYHRLVEKQPSKISPSAQTDTIVIILQRNTMQYFRCQNSQYFNSISKIFLRE